MFHTVYCRSSNVMNGQLFAHWCNETAAFDETPDFDPPDFDPPFEELNTTTWTAIAVIYDRAKRPIQFLRFTGQKCAERVEGAVETLRDRGYYRSKADLVEHLRASVQAFEIEFDEELASEDVWEFLDVIETRLAREFDGVIFSDEEGVFDGRNKPIVAFS